MITTVILLLLAAAAAAFWLLTRSPVAPRSPDCPNPPPPPPPPSASAWMFVEGDDSVYRVPPLLPNDPRRLGMSIGFREVPPAGVEAYEFIGTVVNTDEAASLIADSSGPEATMPTPHQWVFYYAIAADKPRHVRRREVRGDQRGPWQYLGNVSPFLRPTG